MLACGPTDRALESPVFSFMFKSFVMLCIFSASLNIEIVNDENVRCCSTYTWSSMNHSLRLQSFRALIKRVAIVVSSYPDTDNTVLPHTSRFKLSGQLISQSFLKAGARRIPIEVPTIPREIFDTNCRHNDTAFGCGCYTQSLYHKIQYDCV
jgi:hypothetical protein